MWRMLIKVSHNTVNSCQDTDRFCFRRLPRYYGLAPAYVDLNWDHFVLPSLRLTLRCQMKKRSKMLQSTLPQPQCRLLQFTLSQCLLKSLRSTLLQWLLQFIQSTIPRYLPRRLRKLRHPPTSTQRLPHQFQFQSQFPSHPSAVNNIRNSVRFIIQVKTLFANYYGFQC